ncbi:MAG: pseudouridine synthase [Limnohabitans sp.]|nr:pseudouridine synthase [Limnohabitans sp.]MDP4734775.1 pseudouridine synthase [Limnohabitans sp.]MDP4770887.1 pseudouridine synthase [Limnohabitans sp.]
MNDSSSNAQGQRPGVYAARKSGAPAVPSTPATPYKAIDLAAVVSGQFDDEDAAEEVAQDLGKRVLAPQIDSPKLHKVLAQAGMGSRLEMEKLITEGRIAVNNEPAHVGQRVQYGDQIKVDGKPIRIRIDPPPARVIAYHKPAGEIVSHDDPQNRPSVFRKLPRLQNGKWQSVGRLDLNTEGLLLFTSSGELANQLMHPRFGLEREYAVRVLGALSKDEKQKLLDGVMLDDGPAQFGSIEDGGGEGSNCWYRVTISEGRNREVRRMMEAVGHAVSRLIRIRYGAMVLPHGLRRGAWLELDESDIRSLMRAAGTSERPRPVSEHPVRTNRNDRRPRTGGQGRAGSAVPRAKPAAKPNQAPGGSGLHAKSDAPKSEPKYIGAESFNRLKNTPGGPGRGGRGGSGRSR